MKQYEKLMGNWKQLTMKSRLANLINKQSSNTKDYYYLPWIKKKNTHAVLLLANVDKY